MDKKAETKRLAYKKEKKKELEERLRREQEAEAERIRLEKLETERELQSFLIQRKTDVFKYFDIERPKYYRIIAELDKKVKEVIESNQSENLNVLFTIEMIVDTTGKVSQTILFNQGSKQIASNIKSNIKSVEMPIANHEMGYTVNAKLKKSYTIKRTSSELTIKVSNKGFDLKDGDWTAFSKHSSYLKSHIKSPVGSYKIRLVENSFNGISDKDIQYLKFKSVGGPIYGTLSVLMPGLGNHFVNGKRVLYLAKT